MLENKQDLRKKLIKQRKALSIVEWKEKSDRLCKNLERLNIYQKAELILGYFSFKKEPNLEVLFSNNKQKKWGFPRCENNDLKWHLWKYENKLEKGIYGISEPSSILPLIKPNEVDLILIPAVACDEKGYRLGYGGGYYDRMLSLPEWQNIPTIGIIFDFAYVLKLPIEKWDQKLNFVCTESQIHLIN